MKSKNPLGPWELVSDEPIFGTRKKGYRSELAIGGGYDHLEFQDTEDPYCETGHNSLFVGPDGNVWSSCHYMMYEKRPNPYRQTFESRELIPQISYEPIYYENGRFYIKGPTWTEQIVNY
ncbi:hypothetical protein ACFLTE_00280 [Bacteroidota bacterium]